MSVILFFLTSDVISNIICCMNSRNNPNWLGSIYFKLFYWFIFLFLCTVCSLPPTAVICMLAVVLRILSIRLFFLWDHLNPPTSSSTLFVSFGFFSPPLLLHGSTLIGFSESHRPYSSGSGRCGHRCFQMMCAEEASLGWGFLRHVMLMSGSGSVYKRTQGVSQVSQLSFLFLFFPSLFFAAGLQ